MRWKVPVAILLLAVGVGAVVFAITGGPGGGRASGPQYLTATASSGDVARTVDATGSLARATTFGLNFGVAPAVLDASGAGGSGSGTWSVAEVKVAVGDSVKKGQVLAKADATTLERNLAAARLTLKSAKSQKTTAKKNYDNAVGTDARRQALIGYDNAVSQVLQAEGNVSDLADQVAHMTIVAPADGTVTAVGAVTGTDLSGGPAITLASGPLQVTADFTETDLPSLKLEQPATVTIDAVGADVPGKVVAIAPSSASSSGNSVVTYAVTIQLDEPPAAARPGMSAKAAVTTARATGVLSVPAVALNGSAPTYTVLVMAPDGSVQARDVTVGLVTSSQAEIQNGLQPGEAVVIGTTAAQNATTTGGGFGLPGGGGTFRGGGGGGNGGGNGGRIP